MKSEFRMACGKRQKVDEGMNMAGCIAEENGGIVEAEERVTGVVDIAVYEELRKIILESDTCWAVAERAYVYGYGQASIK